MPVSKTHNEIKLSAPHGTRFTLIGSDVFLQFERGREREMMKHLHENIQCTLEPEAIKYETLEAKRKAFEESPEEMKNKLKELAPEAFAELQPVKPIQENRDTVGDINGMDVG